MESRKNWSASQWEEYLTSIEGKQTELLLTNPRLVEEISEKNFKEGFSTLVGTNYSSKLIKVVDLLMDNLTQNQKTVLHFIFWESMSLREVAAKMGVNHAAVRNTRDRALSRLAVILLKSVSPPKNDKAA